MKFWAGPLGWQNHRPTPGDKFGSEFFQSAPLDKINLFSCPVLKITFFIILYNYNKFIRLEQVI